MSWKIWAHRISSITTILCIPVPNTNEPLTNVLDLRCFFPKRKEEVLNEPLSTRPLLACLMVISVPCISNARTSEHLYTYFMPSLFMPLSSAKKVLTPHVNTLNL